MFVVDTNILLYAADQAAAEHDRCQQLLEGWRRQPAAWYITWGIVYEFLRVATHPRVFRNPWKMPEAWGFIEALFSSASLQVLVETERHRRVAEELFARHPHLSGNTVFDGHTAILMNEHGIQRIVTRDMDFQRFPFLTVVDPMVEAE
jgi:toxin-antitoxin system PIN domain toxin